MLCDPTVSAPVESEATPATSVPVPMLVAPSKKVTVPVGTPVAGATGATVAVKVVDCPDVVGLIDEASVVVVLPAPTTWVSTLDVLVA